MVIVAVDVNIWPLFALITLEPLVVTGGVGEGEFDKEIKNRF